MRIRSIKNRILTFIDEDLTTPDYITEAILDQIITDAVETIYEEIHDFVTQGILITRSGRLIYTLRELDPDAMMVKRVWNQSDKEPLRPISIEELDGSVDEWMRVSGNTPQFWYSVSHDAFGIYPKPTNGGDILMVEYLKWPDVLLADNDTPLLKEEDADLVVSYGIYDALIMQFFLDRALDIFTSFSGFFRDSKFREQTRKFQHQITERSSGEGVRTIPHGNG